MVLDVPAARPDAAPGVPAGFEQAVIFATNSVHLEQNSVVVSGDVVVNDHSPGPTLANQRELTIGIAATTPAGYAVKADRIKVKQNAVVGGDLFCNDLDGIGSLTCQALGLPVFGFLPPFVAQAPRADAPDVFVPEGGSATLPPGDYGLIDVNQNGVVTFTGGVYNVREIDFGLSTALRFKAPSEIRVEGKLSIDQNSFAGPDSGSGISASDVVLYVAGINGTNGNLGATPKAAKIGLGAQIHANLYVPNGTLWLRQNSQSTGAFLGKDVDLGIGAQVTLDSAFANRPPVAHPQTVYTEGPDAIDILLTGSDPEGDSLTFSIASGPSEGMLSAIDPVVPPPVRRCSISQTTCTVDGDCPEFPAETCDEQAVAVTSARVTYTPDTGDDLADAFTFQVDATGGFGQAVVSINPPGDPTPPPVPVTTVVAQGGAAATTTDSPITLVLQADAPCDGLCDGEGVDDDTPLTFAIVVGPEHGALGPVVQGEEVPRRTAFVVYTPAEGFVSPPDDSFTFEACGTIGGAGVCDEAVVTINVFAPQATAHDQKVSTPVDAPIEITLTGAPGLTGAEQRATSGARVLIGRAAVLDGAEIAGNVADANGDGFGDNRNNLPGPAPVLMSAGVDLTGGAGSNGVVRMQIEWNISGLAGSEIESAEVLLHTRKGTVDVLDTSFFVGTEEQDGGLSNSDFEAPAEAIPGVVMPVPAGPSGTEGTFSFDVEELLVDALVAGRNFFSIQGRVDEELAGSGSKRGLQVYTTANNSVAANKQPFLSITTPGAGPPPLTFSIVSLPVSGTLRDAFGNLIEEAPTVLPAVPLPFVNRVTYHPAAEFTGIVEFQFQVDDGLTTAIGLVEVIVGTGFGFGNCEDDEIFCDDGRP